MARGNTAGISLPLPKFGGKIPAPPGWAIPVLVGAIIGQLVWDYVSEDGQEAGYDWTGWTVTQDCGQGVGSPRRWSQSLSTSCLINQAVNYPTIRPQDNYAALAITYETAGGVMRLANTKNYARNQPGVLLPWEINGSAGAYPPALPPRAAIRMPAALPHYATLQDTLPLTVAHPLPIPLSIPGLRPEVAGYPGDQWDARRYGITTRPYYPYDRGREVVLQPGAPPITRPGAPNRPPEKGTKERKYRVSAPLRLALRVINSITEANDVLDVLHNALPDSCRAKPVALSPRGFIARTAFGEVRRDDRTLAEKWAGNAALPSWKVHSSTAASPDFQRYHKPRRVNEVVGVDANGKKVWGWKGKLKFQRTHRKPTMQEKALAIYNCLDHIDLREAIGGLLVEQIEDMAYGRFSQALARSLPKQYQRPLGPEAGLGFWPSI